MAIPEQIMSKFNAMLAFAEAGRLNIMEVKEKATGKTAYVMCVAMDDDSVDSGIVMAPVARWFEDEQEGYDKYEPPPDDITVLPDDPTPDILKVTPKKTNKSRKKVRK